MAVEWHLPFLEPALDAGPRVPLLTSHPEPLCLGRRRDPFCGPRTCRGGCMQRRQVAVKGGSGDGKKSWDATATPSVGQGRVTVR
jgi:hypothetical protein